MYSPTKRIPLDPKHQTINRYTVLRLAKQSGVPDTLVTQEPVANGNYSNAVGEFKTKGVNNLSEDDMNTLTHKIEDHLLKQALANKKSKNWAKKNWKKQEAARRTPRERKDRLP